MCERCGSKDLQVEMADYDPDAHRDFRVVKCNLCGDEWREYAGVDDQGHEVWITSR